jgi:hypothetical protein
MYHFLVLTIQDSHDQETVSEITGSRRPIPPFSSNNNDDYFNCAFHFAQDSSTFHA